MQYRSPVGFGPPLNTCPRWPPQVLQSTSVLGIRREKSFRVFTLPLAAGFQKLGQPVPESYFSAEENNGLPQPAQA